MPIRIYALAKELQYDSKQLVDVCAKAGVGGKGSALASLTDEEVEKVKAFINGSGRPGAPVRPNPADAPADTIKTISRPPSPPSAPKAPVVAEPEETPAAPVEPPPSSTPAATPASTPSAVPVAGPAASASPQPPLNVPTRGGFTARPTGKIKVLGARSRRSSEAGEGSDDETTKSAPKKREPVVKLAAMPQSKAPVIETKPDEPAPQKPDIKLPQDAIRGAREGSKAPLEKFTTQQDIKRKKAAKGDPAAPAAETINTSKPARGRRGKDTETQADQGDAPRRGLAGMAGGRAGRQQNRRRRNDGTEDYGHRRRRQLVRRRGANDTAAPRKKNVSLELPCTLKEFSEATGVGVPQFQRALMQLGTMATINHQVDLELAELLAADFELSIDLKAATTLEDSVLGAFQEVEDDPADLESRPPVVTFLGHVDHGKTSLLDYIIGSTVVTGEAGGITQHIRAYSVTKDGRKISFVDTPGHEAFTEMRARGANVTDIAVLVVAADDGIMPQTEEAISHARAADVPIVVALNKIDLPGVDIDRIYQQLSTHGLLPSEWGGDVEVVKTSAISGEGMDTLLETLLLTADIHEYQANPHRPAEGVCLEAEQEAGRGVIAKMIVKNGTLKVGDIVLCGSAHGRVKAMYDTRDARKKLKEAGPSMPVNVTGLDKAPNAGDSFYVIDDLAKARELADSRAHTSRTQSLGGYTRKISFEEFMRRKEEGLLGGGDEPATLNIVLRADVRGSIEAIQKELQKLDHPEVEIKLLQAAVGGITVGDVTLADASNAVVVGFNVIPDESARSLADERGVQVRRYDIIYKLTEDLKNMLEGKLKPEERVADLGRALVQQIFTISRVGTVAGCRVLAGTIERGCRMRVNREGRGIGDYRLDTLRREKDDAKEVREGYECGIKLAGFNDLKEGDILEAYKIEEVARTL